jgi:hypothetical protein
MSSPSTGRRRSGQIPANRRPGPAGRGRRRTRGVWWLDSGWSSKWWGRRRGCTAAATGASRGARPAPVRSRPGQGMGGSRSYCRCKGRWRRARLGLRPAGTRSSPRQPLMAPAGGSGRGRWAREELALWRLLYSGSVPTLLC